MRDYWTGFGLNDWVYWYLIHATQNYN
jgi:hypothetical protein